MKKRYKKKVDQIVTAVQLSLVTHGFAYEKWDNTQHCNSGDWVVENNGDCYTIREDSFAATYQRVSEGRYKKMAHVIAEQIDAAGTLATREGSTSYAAGDYLVFNSGDDSDGYAVSKEKFETMYVEEFSTDDTGNPTWGKTSYHWLQKLLRPLGYTHYPRRSLNGSLL